MLTTSGGMVIRTRVSTMRTIGRNTQGVRLIKLDEGDTVSSLAKLPEDELGDAAELEPTVPDGQLAEPGTETGNGDESPFSFEEHRPPIIDDSGGEASDHIDSNGDDNGTHGLDDEPSAQP